MSGIVFAVPGDLSLPTGGYSYARHVLAEWAASGVEARHLALPDSFPQPTAEDLADTGRIVLSQGLDEVLLVDGLAYGAFPEALAAGLAGRAAVLLHHPLGFETGLSPEQASLMIEQEKAALRHAAAIIVPSETTARLLASEFTVPQERITVAEPGVEPAPIASGSGSDTPALLAVGSVVPRKGYDVLVAALADVADLKWTLTIAGATDRSAGTAEALRRQIAAAGLGDRVRIAGALSASELDQTYDRADLFVLSSLYEGYGMVLTEALARGLPILCTTGGAAAETVPDAAALKVPPGDIAALAAALRVLLGQPARRLAMAQAARRLAPDLPRWSQTAARVAEACRSVMR